jgi:hypothetical protein
LREGNNLSKTEILSENKQELKRLSDTLKEDVNTRLRYYREENKENFWIRIKGNQGMETSEELLRITPPPEYQCKTIDGIVHGIKHIKDEISESEYEEEYDDLRNRLSEIEKIASDLIDEVEEVREAVELVRDWGQEWKDKYKDLLYAVRTKVNYEKYI